MEQVKMGALFLDGVAQLNPKNPACDCDGDIPNYDGLSAITIAEAPKNRPDTFITWNIVPNMEKWSRTGTLLISDRVLLTSVSWSNLEAAGFADGVEVSLQGHKYCCRLLPVDKNCYPMDKFANPLKQTNVNAWDDALDRTTESDSVWHWKHIYFWLNNFESTDYPHLRMTCGYISPRFHEWNLIPYRIGNVGLRLALEPLESDNLFDDAATSEQNTAESPKIKVIIRDGIVESVLGTDAAKSLDVEIVDINKDYEDCEELKDYADELYADPKYREMEFKIARFGDDE